MACLTNSASRPILMETRTGGRHQRVRARRSPPHAHAARPQQPPCSKPYRPHVPCVQQRHSRPGVVQRTVLALVSELVWPGDRPVGTAWVVRCGDNVPHALWPCPPALPSIHSTAFYACCPRRIRRVRAPCNMHGTKITRTSMCGNEHRVWCLLCMPTTPRVGDCRPQVSRSPPKPRSASHVGLLSCNTTALN